MVASGLNKSREAGVWHLVSIKSGGIELSKLSIKSLDTEEFLILAGATDRGDVFDGELCRKLLSISATVADSPTGTIPDFSDQRTTELTKRVNEVEQRNMKHFDEEVLKLDHWSDDLKQGLEREIKELDRQIREARKVASLAASLNDKLEAQKLIRSLESTRKDQRKRLFDAQDEIDSRRDKLIASIEVQLHQKKTISHVFTIHGGCGHDRSRSKSGGLVRRSKSVLFKMGGLDR